MEIDPTILSCISVSSRGFRGVSSTKVKKENITCVYILEYGCLNVICYHLLYKGLPNQNRKKLYKVIYLKKQTQYNDVNLQCSPSTTFHTPFPPLLGEVFWL